VTCHAKIITRSTYFLPFHLPAGLYREYTQPYQRGKPRSTSGCSSGICRRWSGTCAQSSSSDLVRMSAVPHQTYCHPQLNGLTSAYLGISALGGWWGVTFLAPAAQCSYPSSGNQGGTSEFIGPQIVWAWHTLHRIRLALSCCPDLYLNSVNLSRWSDLSYRWVCIWILLMFSS